ncbi:hypothetical protein EA796_11010 [Pseudomonas sp. AOB-7]|nr:hypothetical protein EA796_11010 [Pseudomonas sp. AOB-7]
MLRLRIQAARSCRYVCPRLPPSDVEVLSIPQPDYPAQEHKGTEKAEGKIKGGGTSLARKAVCTGVGDGTH